MTERNVTKNWTDGEPFICTEDDCNLSWGCAPKGKKFRCAICGHKFQAGDKVRWVYTNYGGSPIPGNPFVCHSCAPTKEQAIDILTQMKEQSKKLWWFRQ